MASTSELIEKHGFKEEEFEIYKNNKVKTGFPEPLVHFRFVWEAQNVSMEYVSVVLALQHVNLVMSQDMWGVVLMILMELVVEPEKYVQVEHVLLPLYLVFVDGLMENPLLINQLRVYPCSVLAFSSRLF